MSRAEIGAGDRERISNFTMASHYVLPKLLLAAVLLGKRGQAKSASRPPDRQPLPRGVAPGAPRVDPLDPRLARGQAVDLFAEIRARHGFSALADYYRSVARAGDFLRVAWNPLRPVIGDPEFDATVQTVLQAAKAVATELQPAGTWPASLSEEAVGGFVRRVAAVGQQVLSTMLVELTIIKALTDGPETATTNTYSLTDIAPAKAPEQ